VGEAGADGEAISVIRIAEAEIGADLGRQLQALLQECFPGYPGRSYFKLPPHFRSLAMTGSGGVAAQMGVELRVVRVGVAVVRTFGIVDLCVRESRRSRGLAGRLLAEVSGLARSCGMAFIVLFADDDRLYALNGWVRVTNRCRPGQTVRSTCWVTCSDTVIVAAIWIWMPANVLVPPPWP
jgi:GNAT superfamily N-acetyltransferase